MLLNADIFWHILCVGQIKSDKHPLLQKTQLGWIVAGRTPTHKNTYFHQASCNFVTTTAIDKALEKFWALEDVLIIKSFTAEEEVCEMHFIKFISTNRNADGRFVVELPFKEEQSSMLGNSKDVAMKRFFRLKRKLAKEPALRQQYIQFMNEYITLGHVKRIDPFISESEFYLPYHAVIKESSVTTKLRVVFDGSSKSSTDISLNECRMVGPILQEDLFSIIARFRTHQ